ncbi:hypothetical protein CEXT_762891 [Caerostris extrusa]|uniref:Uncharacterized protein n=1 Tax=Caerostris extrusa TaxID=172846 RepID=A0AAV4X8R7_CAEEX|nr:hypothetical protein CEXT_762891 [Caerostris extrusa]
MPFRTDRAMEGESISNSTRKYGTISIKLKTNKKKSSSEKKSRLLSKIDLPISVPIIAGRIRHRDMLLMNGDIVSLANAQRQVHHTEIQCLLQDQHHLNSALIAWFPTEKKNLLLICYLYY